MGPRNTEVLVSGASVAGPTLAWWLHRHGFTPTVVEQNPALRAGLGGHAVDLFGPAVDVAEWMGVLPKVQAARTQTELVVVERPGRRPIQVDVSGLVAGISDRHVEIMRGELTSSSTRPPATTSTTASATRSGPWTRTATGSRSPSSTAHRGASTWSSAPTGCTPTCAGWSSATRPASVTSWAATSGSTPCPTTAASRAGWSAGAPPAGPPPCTRCARPVRRGRCSCSGRPRSSATTTPTWRRSGGCCARRSPTGPGSCPASSRSWTAPPTPTSTRSARSGCRAGRAGGHPGGGRRLLAGPERALGELVRRSRALGPAVMKTIIPATPRQVWLTDQALRLIPRLPGPLQRRLWAFQARPARALEAVDLARYRALGGQGG